MNIIFLSYFTLITALCFLHKYKWGIAISLLAAIHTFWICTKISFPKPFFPAVFSIFIFNTSIFLIYKYLSLKKQNLESIKSNYQKEENKLNQLSTQEKSLHERNKRLERSINETVNIYEYVKKLGSTLDFTEAVTVLQQILRSLIEFSRGKLVLIENNNITKTYNIRYESDVPPSDKEKHQSSKMLSFERHIIDKMLKNPQTILYEKGKVSPLGQLPSDTVSLIALPLTVEKQLVSTLILENLPLVNLDRIQFIAIQFALEVKKTQLYQKVKELSIIDSLTGLYLRRHFQKLLNNEFDRCYRQEQPLSFLMIDIDWFKRYNDEYGHLAGDLILKIVGSILKQKSREIDLLCRYGGDEFALVLPRTGLKEAQMVAGRLRRGISEHLFNIAKEEFQVTVSIGVANCPPKDMRKPDISPELTDRADKAMYQAKAQGRNRIVVSPS